MFPGGEGRYSDWLIRGDKRACNPWGLLKEEREPMKTVERFWGGNKHDFLREEKGLQVPVL